MEMNLAPAGVFSYRNLRIRKPDYSSLPEKTGPEFDYASSFFHSSTDEVLAVAMKVLSIHEANEAKQDSAGAGDRKESKAEGAAGTGTGAGS